MVNRLKGKKVIGIKQSLKSLRNNEGKIVYIAKDADYKMVESIIDLAKSHNLEIVYVDTMKELGRLCGIDVGASAVVMLSE